ncbi:MAG: class I SAM-dependent methyltransferase [Burkholderiales bacterium]|nr:class I SAM-dependent methyltransferase [Burkholderiales bacterium]
MHAPLPSPSNWVTRWAPLIPAGGRVLDLACGSGRHLRWLAEQGWVVTGVDRDAEAVQRLRGMAEIVVADLEGGPWPLLDRRFDGIVVTNYLWRALLPRVAESLNAGGVLIYETFAEGQERFGRPNNPEFLLQRGELLQAFADLSIVAYEDGLEAAPERRVQRIVAVAGGAPGAPGQDPRIAAFEPRRLL